MNQQLRRKLDHITDTLWAGGVTNPVTFATTLKPNASNANVMDIQSSAMINRSDFGMRKGIGGVGEKVNIQLTGQWKAK